ncbi:MAG TPA: type II toxin-antitoxin system RelE/ParE family toxin [Verrucomicrobiae bacterium]|nr:type II toxin-antitoxin system RelE/ParE family toxin [Verrucomicrobiae bacterium]
MSKVRYQIRFSQESMDNLSSLPPRHAAQIVRKIERLESGLHGDIKALRNAEYGFRLRMGDYRVLFDVESDRVLIQKIGHRRKIYD